MIANLFICIQMLINVINFTNIDTNNSISVFNGVTNNNTVTMCFVGDVMVHSPQLPAQYNKKTENYDFNNNFKYVKKYVEAADIAVCNFETTLAGKDKGGYEGFPLFNSPDSLADALKNAGFDILCLANNHMIDRGTYGVDRTMDVLDDKDLLYLGARRDKSDKNYIMLDKGNIKIAITAYTFGKSVNGKDTINGNYLANDLKTRINKFEYETLNNDLQKMKKNIEEMKDEGADCIIYVLHWGNEYDEEPNKYQQVIAEYLSKNGVDVIIGSHPHVLQRFDVIEDSGHISYVFYSLGNFLSNQRYELMGQRDSENGIIVSFDISKKIGGVNISNITYIPTWVNKYFTKTNRVYEILPLNEKLANFNLSYKDNKWRAENALKLINKVLDRGNMKLEMEK